MQQGNKKLPSSIVTTAYILTLLLMTPSYCRHYSKKVSADQ
jgi:hypothetical protein